MQSQSARSTVTAITAGLFCLLVVFSPSLRSQIGGPPALVIAGAIVGLLLLIVIFLVGQFLHLYIQASVSGAHVGVFELIGMRLRRADIPAVVYGRIRLVRAGFQVSTGELEAHGLAGGCLSRVVGALITAKQAGISLGFETACLADRNGYDPLAAVGVMANPQDQSAEPDAIVAAYWLLLAMRDSGVITAGIRLPPLPDR